MMRSEFAIPSAARFLGIVSAAARVAPGTRLFRGVEIAIAIGGSGAIAAFVLHRGGIAPIFAIDRRPSFWLLLSIYLTIQPICDLLAFRAIWPVSWHALPVLFRKAAINEVVMGYLGDLHLYAWAKGNRQTSSSAFAAIKDSAIVSALIGNLYAITLTIVAWPWFSSLDLGSRRLPLLASLFFVLGPVLAMSLFRRRVFASPRAALMRIGFSHALRVAGMMLVLCLLWQAVIPAVSLSSLLLLSTGRQLLTRLPLAPNKDLILAALVALLAVPGSGLGAGIAAVAGVIAISQAFIGLIFLLSSLGARLRRERHRHAGCPRSCSRLVGPPCLPEDDADRGVLEHERASRSWWNASRPVAP